MTTAHENEERDRDAQPKGADSAQPPAAERERCRQREGDDQQRQRGTPLLGVGIEAEQDGAEVVLDDGPAGPGSSRALARSIGDEDAVHEGPSPYIGQPIDRQGDEGDGKSHIHRCCKHMDADPVAPADAGRRGL